MSNRLVREFSPFGWTAGGISRQLILGDGCYQFSVGAVVAGVVTGLNDHSLGEGYVDINYALYCHGGTYEVIENGVLVGVSGSYASDTVFTIARIGVTVSYFVGSSKIYQSLVHNSGTLFADASLYFTGDYIADAFITDTPAAEFSSTEGLVNDYIRIDTFSTNASALVADHLSLDTFSYGTGLSQVADHIDIATRAMGAGVAIVQDNLGDISTYAESGLLEPPFAVVHDTIDLLTTAEGAFNLEDNVEESGTFIEEFLYGQQDVMLSDGVFVTAYEEDSGYLVVSNGVFSDDTVSSGTMLNTLVETGVLSSAIEDVVADVALSEGVFSNDYSLAISNEVEESGVFTSVATTNSALVSTAISSGTFTTSVGSWQADDTVEAGVFTSVMSTSATAESNILETGLFESNYLTVNTAQDDALSQGVFSSDTYSILVAALNAVVEQGYFTDSTQGGGATGAWTAHLETFAMSRYTNFPFTSMAVVDGVLVGTADGGVYRLDADADAGVAIDASVVHDWSDDVPDRNGEMHSNEYLKHARYLYVGSVIAGPIGFDLGYIDAAGLETSARYTFFFATQGGYSTNRASLGRGVRSRFVRPTLFNIDGADFAINDATLVVELSNRRM